MITSIKAVVTDSTEPFHNIALESRLLDVCDGHTVYMYLWRNDKTVVIGKFQNAFQECDIDRLQSVGGTLVRRLTGGGAVYHDVNNLNFSFVAHKDNYDKARQQAVILRAVRRLGIKAEVSGRNDITVDGKKFSGNSFLTRGDVTLHNGTIMIDTDKDMMSKCLTVSKDKMQSKGVASVRSRTVNLRQYDKTLTTGKMALELLRAFGDVYELPVQLIKEDELGSAEIEKIKTDVFMNDAFRFGTNPSFTDTVSGRFAWGGVEVRYSSGRYAVSVRERICKVFAGRLQAVRKRRCDRRYLHVSIYRRKTLRALCHFPESLRAATLFLQGLHRPYG